MADSDKRLQYYHGQFLQKEDFIEEQTYHLDRLRRHNRQQHTSGIAEGLTVAANVGEAWATVQPGTAIDSEGRPIVLASPRTVPFGTLTGSMLVVTSYRERSAAPATVGDQGDTRWLEDPDVEVIPASGAPPANVRIQLAKLRLNNGRLAEPQDTSVRTSAGVNLGTEVAIERIRLSRPGVASTLWPALTSGAPNRMDLVGDLSMTGNVLVTGTVDGRDVSADGVKLDTHAGNIDNPHKTTAAQVGALPGSAYLRRKLASVIFDNNDPSGATRTIDVGFRPKFIWMDGILQVNGPYPVLGGVLGGLCQVDDAGGFETSGHGPVVSINSSSSFMLQNTAGGSIDMEFADSRADSRCHMQGRIQIDAITTTGFRLKFVKTVPAGFLQPATFVVVLSLAVIG